MKLLIVGATGGTGQELVKQALEQGHQLTVLVRKPEKNKIIHQNIRLLKGDVLDFDSVQTAAIGQDAV